MHFPNEYLLLESFFIYSKSEWNTLSKIFLHKFRLALIEKKNVLIEWNNLGKHTIVYCTVYTEFKDSKLDVCFISDTCCKIKSIDRSIDFDRKKRQNSFPVAEKTAREFLKSRWESFILNYTLLIQLLHQHGKK